MKAHRITAVVIRHFYEARRNVDRIIDIIYWPVMDVLVWGLVTVYLARGGQTRSPIAGFLLAAAILWGAFYSFQRDMAVGFLDELWSRNLINLFSTPLSVSEYVVGLIAVNFVKVIVGLSAAAAVAWLFYSFNIGTAFPALLPFFALLLVFALAVGVVITGMIFRFTTRIQTLAWSFAGMLAPISCVFYPLTSLPKPLQPIAWALPTTHAFEGMRQVLAGAGFSSEHFIWGAALNVAYLALAMAAFVGLFNAARSRGLLVKIE